MTQTVEDFAELNDYDMEKATAIVRGWAEHSKNPGLKNVAESWLEASGLN